MLKNITKRQRRKIVMREIQFMYDGNGGYAFPCDESGNLLPMEECARANYDRCMAHPEKFKVWVNS